MTPAGLLMAGVSIILRRLLTVQHVLLGIAGSIGATLRYMISILFSTNQLLVFPFSTVTVNLLGCFILGLLSSSLELKINVEPKYLTAFKTGLIGSFTTFSTFSVEVIQLLQHNYYLYAIIYILNSAIFGLGFAALGLNLGKRLGERKRSL